MAYGLEIVWPQTATMPNLFVCLKTDRLVVNVSYDEDRDLGGFILIDKISNATSALGMVVPAEPETAASAEPIRDWHGRSLLKATTWRIIGSIDTFVLSWLFTGHIGVAGSIAGTEIFTKIGLFYVHERVWAVLPWGKTGGSILGESLLQRLIRRVAKG